MINNLITFHLLKKNIIVMEFWWAMGTVTHHGQVLGLIILGNLYLIIHCIN